MFTLAHHFVIMKGGWKHLEKYVSTFKMAQPHLRFIDLEGFYQMFRERTKAKAYSHIFYYPGDIVQNELSLQEQEVKKEKWRVLSRSMDFIKALDKNYDPLEGPKFMGDKIEKLMTHFATIMETLEKKKVNLMKGYQEKDGNILEDLIRNPTINLGQYTFQKKEKYIVVRPISTYKRPQECSPPDRPTKKRQRVVEEE